MLMLWTRSLSCYGERTGLVRLQGRVFGGGEEDVRGDDALQHVRANLTLEPKAFDGMGFVPCRRWFVRQVWSEKE